MFAEIENLLARREKTRKGDERFALDQQLVSELGSALDDATYLSICREHGWTVDAMTRLFTVGRAEDAVAEGAAVISAAAPPYAPWHLLEIIKLLLRFKRAEDAEAQLRPWADHDVQTAELYVSCLEALGRPDVVDACLMWFKRRPTPPTYRAIAQRLTAEQLGVLHPRIIEQLESRRLYAIAVEIAEAAGDEQTAARLRPHLPKPPDPTPAPETAPVPVSAAEMPDGLAVGSRVRHKKFGVGNVGAVEGDGDARKLTVEFDDAGTKTLLARFVVAEPSD